MQISDSLKATATHPKTFVTADELWQLSAIGKNYELVRGELKEMAPPGGLHGKLSLRLGRFLQDFVDAHQLGEVMVETGFRLADSPDTVRSPDASFISTERLPADGLPEGYIPGPPDLAVEVVSPDDTASEVQDKVRDYLAYGTQQVWVVYPQQRLVIVHDPDGTAKTLQAQDTLSGETVIPGFACRMADIFS